MLLVPPLPQQRAIADYLDRETARLDALVAAKELSARAVGREAPGAHHPCRYPRSRHSNVPFRDSGIPWLGEIPDTLGGVEARPLKRLRLLA